MVPYGTGICYDVIFYLFFVQFFFIGVYACFALHNLCINSFCRLGLRKDLQINMRMVLKRAFAYDRV